MNPSLAQASTHPLSGLETWPKTGPIYGFVEEESVQPGTVWDRIGKHFRKPAPMESNLPQARIWY